MCSALKGVATTVEAHSGRSRGHSKLPTLDHPFQHFPRGQPSQDRILTGPGREPNTPGLRVFRARQSISTEPKNCARCLHAALDETVHRRRTAARTTHHAIRNSRTRSHL